jgi:alpha-N-arabinofuranosidase
MLGILDRAGCRGHVKIAFDEWNLRGWHHPGFPRKQPVEADDKEAAEFIAKRDINDIAGQYTMADALFTASFLNACLRHCDDVGMANIAPIVNTRGPLYVHPKGVVRRTTFHTLSMYANLLESRVAKLAVEASPYGGGKVSMPVIDAVATVDGAGKKWAIALVNRHPSETATCTVRLGERSLDGTFDATILAGDSPEAYNDVEHAGRAVPERRKLNFTKGTAGLPPHSLTIVRAAGP